MFLFFNTKNIYWFNRCNTIYTLIYMPISKKDVECMSFILQCVLNHLNIASLKIIKRFKINIFLFIFPIILYWMFRVPKAAKRKCVEIGMYELRLSWYQIINFLLYLESWHLLSYVHTHGKKNFKHEEGDIDVEFCFTTVFFFLNWSNKCIILWFKD